MELSLIYIFKTHSMTRKILLFFSLISCLSFHSFAQKTEVNQQSEELFYHGVELYEKKLYGSSLQEFERFLQRDRWANLLMEQAEIYILINHLHLNHNNAEKNLEKKLDKGPQTSLHNLAQFELGNFYFNQGKYTKAAKIFKGLYINNLPNDYWSEANFKMGYAFFKDKEYETAQDHFNKIRNQQGKYYVEANYFYGYICYVQFKYDCAITSFKRIAEDGPEIMHLYMAHIYYAQGAYKQSLDYLQSHPTDKYTDEYNLISAKNLYQLEDYKKAFSYFKQMDVNSELMTNEDVYMMGYVHYLEKVYQTAQVAFVKISGLESPLGQLANYQLGQSFLFLNEKQKALSALGVAKRMDFQKEIQEIAHFNYARLSYELGAHNSAISTTQDFIESFPNSEYVDDAKGMLADMLVSTKNYTQAVRILDEIKTFNEATKKVYQKINYAWAEQLFIDADFTNSANYFNKSLRFTPDRLKEAQAYYWLGEMEFKQENYAQSIQHYTRMMNNSAATSSRYYNYSLYNLGYAYYQQKDYGKALNYFQQYQQKSSFGADREVYADNALRLGDCFFLKSQYSKAAEAYNVVSSGKHPESDYALYQQGIIYGLMRRPNDKISTLKKIQSDHKQSIYLDDAIYQIAETYLQDLANPELAMSMYNLLVSQHEESIYTAPAYVKMGLIFFDKGDNQKALSYCKTVVEKYPRTRSAQEAMAVIESVYVKMGKVDEYLDYLATMENGDIRVTYQDSLMYESALQKFRVGDCAAASKGFKDYKKRFADKGFFLLHANYYVGECAFRNEDYEQAVENFEFVAKQNMNEFSEDVNLKLAEIFFYQARYDRALPYFSNLERIANSKANFVKALVGQMRCNYTLGNYDAAKNNATAILPIENIDIEILIETNLTLGKIQFNANNLLTSMFHLDYVVNESKTERGAEAQYYRSMILYKQLKYDECREAIFTLGDKYASYEYWAVKGFILLADVYTAEKDYFQARATLQTILDGYEGDQSLIDEIKSKLAKLDELEKK